MSHTIQEWGDKRIDQRLRETNGWLTGISNNIWKTYIEIRDNLAPNTRYGRKLEAVFWVYGDVTIAPQAGSKLIAYKPQAGSGKRAWIYGFYLDNSEPNIYRIEWTSGGNTRKYRFRTTGAGTLHVELSVPINEGIQADPETEVYILVEKPGSPESEYQAGLLIGETG